MSEPASLVPIAWVQQPDGRLEPFTADRICRSLFAATELLGQPDPFLARELTDSILHFLAAEAGPSPPTTAELADLIAKVVRELGQPALARAYEQVRNRPSSGGGTQEEANGLEKVRQLLALGQLPPEEQIRQAGAEVLRQLSLQEVFSRDIRAAHLDGLVTLTGLEAPFELAAGVLTPGEETITQAVAAMRSVVGEYLALDSPEYGASMDPAALVSELALALRLTGLKAVVNLNCRQRPPWAGNLAEGPLFAANQPKAEFCSPTAAADHWAEALTAKVVPALRLDWHVSEPDFDPGGAARLGRMVRAARDGAAVNFVFDRPRRPVALAEGLDRRHFAVLMFVGLHLPRLASLAGGETERFFQRLSSLVRLALSAGVQKRDFLRRQATARPALRRGFLLDRSRLVVVPVGLWTAVRALGSARPARELAREILQQLQQNLMRDGPACQLEATLGHKPSGFPHAAAQDLTAELYPFLGGDPKSFPESGLLNLALPSEASPAVDELVSLLEKVWRTTDTARLRFVPTPSGPPSTAWWSAPTDAATL